MHEERTRPWQLLRRASRDALAGDQPACRSRVAQATLLAAPDFAPLVDACGEQVLGFLELGQGNLDVAIWHLDRAARSLSGLGVEDPLLVQLEPDLIECLLARGQRDQAASSAHALTLRAQRFGSDWARAAACRCHGMMADAAGFEAHFRAALTIGAGGDSFALARTQLLFGERLRRARRRVDARVQLAAALGTFEHLGAAPWSRRAVRELEATTITARTRRDIDAVDELTPQERTVVRLLAEGLTVRETALRLFISPKTVEAHLGRAYRKLGVRNRAQLVTKLGQPSLQAAA